MYKQLQRIHSQYLRSITKLSTNYSTKPVIKEEKNYDEQLKEFERISNISQKIRVKQPQRPPFIKNLLLGQFDYDMLTYPELEKDDWLELEKSVKQIRVFVDENQEIVKSNRLTSEILMKLSRERLLGLKTSLLMNGRNLNVTEMCRFTEELSNTNLNCNEQLGIQILLKYGDDRLKKKYLQRLIDGESLSALCVIEALPRNFERNNNTVTLSSDGKSWTLNGHCRHVINGNTADLFIILAQTDCTVKDNVKEQKLSLFVIERNATVRITQFETINPNLDLSNIVFDNIQIPSENLIGKVGEADKILENIYPEFRLTFAPLCNSINRKLIKNTLDYHIEISNELYPIHETDAIREKIAKIAMSLYAIDSVTYLTAGLIDNYENQDCELESMITKIFASEETLKNTTSCLSLIGPATVEKQHWCTKLHNEATCLMNLPESNDNLKVILALFGLRYAGQQINETIKKLRNPFFNASFIFKRMWSNRRQADDDPKLDLYLHHYLHPSLIKAAQSLEYCVLRLQYATESLLTQHGNHIVNQHIDLKRIADCLIDVYVMTACLGRASRSYCIGLQHADYDISIANMICNDRRERVRNNINQIIGGNYRTNDQNCRLLAKRLFELKDYFVVHPLARNF